MIFDSNSIDVDRSTVRIVDVLSQGNPSSSIQVLVLMDQGISNYVVIILTSAMVVYWFTAHLVRDLDFMVAVPITSMLSRIIIVDTTRHKDLMQLVILARLKISKIEVVFGVIFDVVGNNNHNFGDENVVFILSH